MKINLTDLQKDAIVAFFDQKPYQRLWNCKIGFLTAFEGMPVPEQMAVEMLERKISFADLLEQNRIPLSHEQRVLIEDFLADKTGKQVFQFEDGFLSGDSVTFITDSEAIRRVEECGIKFSTLFH